MASPWRDMKDAPKNRWRVILYCPSEFGRTVFEGYYGFNGQFSAWFKSETHRACNPSSWMPLPDEPETNP